MDSLEILFEFDSALVFGIGGSGDIVGSIPTAKLLDQHGLDILQGGIAWEPVPKDTRPGPRTFDEIDGLDRVSETVGLASAETRTRDALEFTETIVARHYDTETALIDISHVVDAVRQGIDSAASQLDIDLVVGLDAGGDVLAEGGEPDVRSPVTDGIGLVALDDLERAACLGVFGQGSGGELTLDELEARFAEIANHGGIQGSWGLTPRVRNEMEAVLENVETEASRIPVEAAQRQFGHRTIRGGEVSVRLTPTSPVTFHIDPSTVATLSRIATAVREKNSLDQTTAALKDRGCKLSSRPNASESRKHDSLERAVTYRGRGDRGPQ